MSAETVHRNHHESHIAYGTGDHNHHRGRLERDGAAVGYSVCMMGTGPLRACPDEPDPLERLLVKLAERRGVTIASPRPFCDRHAPDKVRVYSGNRLCLDCRSEKRRAERIALRIHRDALRAA